jgi:5'(3')-deoxyribonucleotidase
MSAEQFYSQLAATKRTRQPIIAVDLLTEWVRRYNAEFKDSLNAADIKGWNLEPYMKKADTEEFYGLLARPGFYLTVGVIPGALEAVQRLRDYGRVIFVSACTPGTADQKLTWLRRNGFLPDVEGPSEDWFVAKDKSLINADVLFDDNVSNVERFVQGPQVRMAFLVNHNHNLGSECSVPRVPGMGLARAAECLAAHWGIPRKTATGN